MEMLGRIRRLFYRDRLSRSEVARRTGLSRNTMKRWLALPGKLAPFEAQLRQALEADARRPKRDRRTALALHAELKQAGYEGGYTALTDFIRRWREAAGANTPTRAFVPLKFKLGE